MVAGCHRLLHSLRFWARLDLAQVDVVDLAQVDVGQVHVDRLQASVGGWRGSLFPSKVKRSLIGITLNGL